MRLPARYLVIATAAAGALVAALSVQADTWTLELKRRESQNPRMFDRASYVYWASSPQSFFVQTMSEGKVRLALPGNQEQETAFARLVKKQPKYACAHPFRGVAKLGSQEFAFALDYVPTKAEAEEAKPDGKEGKPDGKKAEPEAKKAEADSPSAKLKGAIAKAITPSAAPMKPFSYNRLYFDFNHNGDLTDDKVIEAVDTGATIPRTVSRSYFQFPRVDVTIDVAGTKLDYSFFLSGYGYGAPQFSYTNVMLNAAVCREGHITLAGKKHHVVLLDFNSNGRFDDESRISKKIRLASGALYPEPGDMLLVDPESMETGSPYDVTGSTVRHNVSKMIKIDDRLYDITISPAGDKLTLSPSSAAMGSVTNPSDSFRAVIYGERGFLAIQGAKGKPVPVPAGQWKVLSYTITQQKRPATAKPAKSQAVEKKGTSADASAREQVAALLKLLGMTVTVHGETVIDRGVAVSDRGVAVVSASATDQYRAVEVRKGKTVVLPFGPPYKPRVTIAPYRMGNGQASLEMSLIGSTGEICTNLTLDGRRPPKPEFTITDPKGKVVDEGDFDYG